MTISERRQQQRDQAVEFIQRLVAERGYPPSIPELRDHMGYRSKQPAHALLVELEEAGRIRRGQGPRAITVLGRP